MSLAICSAALVRALVARFPCPSCFVTRLHPRTARMSLEVQGYRPASPKVFFPKKKKEIVVAFGEDFAPNKDSLPRSLLVVTVTCAGTDKVFYLVHLLYIDA